MNLAPDQFSSLKRILSEPSAKVDALVPDSAGKSQALLQHLEALVRRHDSAFCGKRLLLKHSPAGIGSKYLNDGVVRQLIAAKTDAVLIDDNCNVILAERGDTSLPAAAAESEDSKSLCFVCSPGKIIVFAAGRLIAEIGSDPPSLEERSEWRKGWIELPAIFNDHFSNCVESEQNLRYWKDSKKRTLLIGPDGTEKLFHHSLFWWCNKFIKDALDVYGEAHSMGQDKTDITVVTEVGNIVIEVKWLGTNEKNTRYIEVRIAEGLVQVADYLNRNSRLMSGYLVLYDARSDSDHRQSSTYPEACRHEKCYEPILFFLRSEAPSQRAKRLAAPPKKLKANSK